MATFKYFVNSNYRRNDGTYSVSIRVIHNRKIKYIQTPFYVTSEQITRSGKIKDAMLLDVINKELTRLRAKIVEIGFAADNMTIEQLCLLLKSDKPKEQVDFIAYCEKKIADMEKDIDRVSSAKTIRIALNSFKRYIDSDSINFDDMRRSVVIGWYEWLLDNISVITANSYVKRLKTLYIRARKELNDEEAGIIVVKYSCFDNIEYATPEDIEPRAFDSIEQMQKVIDLPYDQCYIHNFAKDMFVFSFICFGINPRDFFDLKKTDYKDGIITYRRHKIARRVGKDSEQKIKVNEVVKIILDKYSGDPDGYLINYRGGKRRYDTLRSIQNVFVRAGLCDKDDPSQTERIRHKYVFYTARYSMATFAKIHCGIEWLTVNDMLNHSIPQPLKMTRGYVMGKDYTSIWNANEKLLSLFDWSFYLNQKK